MRGNFGGLSGLDMATRDAPAAVDDLCEHDEVTVERENDHMRNRSCRGQYERGVIAAPFCLWELSQC